MRFFTSFREKIRSITKRYGWRTPLVVAGNTISSLGGAKNFVRVGFLRLLSGGSKGAGLILGHGIIYRNGVFLNMGSHCTIGDRVVLEVGLNPKGEFRLGDHVWISHDVHLAAANRLIIGNNVLVGEFCSIRDSSHSHGDSVVPIKFQKDTLGTIVIEDDVWIGRGCIVLGRPEGIVVGRGAIIGANSVVSKSIPAMEIWGGVPAKFLRSRNRTEHIGI
jgi:acetyltransferase-like isoleucine patch superfamily enzyme